MTRTLSQIRVGDHIVTNRELTPAEWQSVQEYITYEMLAGLSRKLKDNAWTKYGSQVGALSPDMTTAYDKSRALFKEMAHGVITITIKADAVLSAKHAVCGDIPVSHTLTIPLFFFAELLKSPGESSRHALAKEVAVNQLKDTLTTKALEGMYVRNVVFSLF